MGNKASGVRPLGDAGHQHDVGAHVLHRAALMMVHDGRGAQCSCRGRVEQVSEVVEKRCGGKLLDCGVCTDVVHRSAPSDRLRGNWG